MAYVLNDRRNKLMYHCSGGKDLISEHSKPPEPIRRFHSSHVEKKSKRTSECPIYIHEYIKIPNANLWNNNNFNDIDAFAKKQLQDTKKVLNKIEETYWSTWKPNKINYNDQKVENTIRPTFRPYSRMETINEMKKENTPYGDVAKELIQYFRKSNFSGTGSVSDETEKHVPIRDFVATQSKVKITPFPLTPSTEELKEKQSTINNIQEQKITNHKISSNNQTVVEQEPHDTVTNGIKDNSHLSIQEENDAKTKLNNFKHIDSFIINKKKKQEVSKEPHFQQPKCIKLYKKSGNNNYVKGGSYPLKSFRKKEGAVKGNFRLGPPGQLVVTGSSFNKKSTR